MTRARYPVEPSRDCFICDAENEGIKLGLAMIRAIDIGRSIERASEPLRERIRLECLCFRHCHQLREHEAWTERNAGKPEPWPEEEPGL